MYRTAGKTRPRKRSPEEQALYFKQHICANSTQKYHDAVSKALYANTKIDVLSLRRSRMLSSIASLMMASLRGHVSEVVTFNFDDLLERYLEWHGAVVHSVIEESQPAASADVTIYHPHGMLPSLVGAPRSGDIVFDKESFSSIVGRDWKLWRQTTFSVLRRHFCVFVGLSGNDLNLSSLLQDSNASHRATGARKEYWGVRFTDAKSRDVNEKSATNAWDSVGVCTWRIDDYDEDLPNLFFEVCQAAAQRRSPTLRRGPANSANGRKAAARPRRR